MKPVETICVDVRIRRWALRRPFVWLWCLMGRLPRWAVVVRPADPPRAVGQCRGKPGIRAGSVPEP